MSLWKMILKNAKYNIKNYTAYLLGNSFIIAILFMFFSLALSKEFMEAQKTNFEITNSLNSTIVLMVAFSIAFIIYTTVSFTKYRGKEFGIYFTIGLTSKNIINILLYENFMIAIASFVFGGVFGTVFLKLFYMAILKLLSITNINIQISSSAYAYIATISGLIFIFNTIYQIMFLKRLSIVEILKSTSKRYIKRGNSLLGIVGIIVITASVVIFHNISNYEINDQPRILIKMFIADIIALYFAIGFAMELIIKILKRSKRIYNNNILCINSFLHRFIAYRTVLYVVIILVAGGIGFISVSYSNYISIDNNLNSIDPYDLSFTVQNDLYKNSLKSTVEASGAKIKSYKVLQGINVFYLVVSKEKINWNGIMIMATSESRYNKLNKDRVAVRRGHAIFAQAGGNNYQVGGIVIDFPKEDDYENSETFRLFCNNGIFPFTRYTKLKQNKGYIYVPEKNITYKDKTINNTLFNSQGTFVRGVSVILSDEDYEKLKKNSSKSSIYDDVLINLNNNNEYKSIEKNLSYNLNKIGGKKLKDTLFLKKKKFSDRMNNDGFSLFAYSFLGVTLLIGSAAILYFKAFTSIEEDRELSKKLFKIGLTNREINNIIIKEIGSIFLVPSIIAIVVTGYYMSTMYKDLKYANYLWHNTLLIFIIYGVIQITFFLLTTSRYLKEIEN
ncbi:ABC transporter permease [Clostridium neuense]|uniref:ABC transporter permease n=1 Tax=Clostridium neuense TaxID=1728934 RepID=A0ABW8TJ20_9CLOT